MGANIGCCNSAIDQTNFKQYCTNHASPQYQSLLTAAINAQSSTDDIRGDWPQDSAKSGKGIIFSPTRFYYEGEILEGKARGKGRIIWENRTVYQGELKDNQANGSGTLKIAQDETTIKGQWLHGEPVLNSKMEVITRNQNFYITFHQLSRNSESQQIESANARIEFSDGSLYEGEVRRSKDGQFKIEGKGRLKFSDGSQYFGDFQGGKMHGKGRYQWAETGHWFEGQYKSNFRDGEGKYFYSGSKFKQGIWRSGHLQAQIQ